MTAPDEFELIRRYFTPSVLPASVALGVGDDCALLRIPAGHEIAVSVDTQVQGVHFPTDADPGLLASRVVRCAASDLAAMGAEPSGFTLALTLPAADETWLAAFSTGLLSAARQLRCPLVGGDTTRGPLSVSVQVLGSVPTGRAIKRSGARLGDQIWVSGSLGDGAAALAWIERRLEATPVLADYLTRRFYQPEIDFVLATQLRGLATACIDVSDGLLADLGHICEASGVGAIIHLDRLPVATAWRDAVPARTRWQWALAGGDDYRLCFTAAADKHKRLLSFDGLYCIGEITADCVVQACEENGAIYPIDSNNGFRHF